VDGAGLFIEGLSTSEKQNVIMTDNAGAQKTYPYYPTLTLPSNTPRGKPHGIRLSTKVPKAVCI